MLLSFYSIRLSFPLPNPFPSHFSFSLFHPPIVSSLSPEGVTRLLLENLLLGKKEKKTGINEMKVRQAISVHKKEREKECG